MTAGEFELMEILWRLGGGTVKEVRSAVDPARGLAYTTVMTVLDKMARKGLLERHKQGKAHVYRPAVGREAAVGAVVDQMVRTYFAGSYPELVRMARLRLEGSEPESLGAAEVARDRPEAPAEDRGEHGGDMDEFLL
jgi:predicted transcriptional regulator